MRVLLVGTQHGADIRGATVAVHGFARGLRDRGHDVTFVQAARPEHRAPIEGVRMEYTGSTRKSVFPALLALRRVGSYDVIHAMDNAGAFFALRSRVERLPLVVEFHPPRVHDEPFWRAGWRWRYIELAARNAPLVVTPSRWLGEGLRARFGLDPARMRVIPHGAGEHWFDAHRPAADVGPARIVVVNMKGVDVALEAFARVGRRDGARLEFYGGHRDLELYRKRARELGIGDATEFFGFVPNRELPARLAGAHLCLHPTRAESFGQVLIETAALGIPALTSRIGGVPEVVEDGVAGVLCPPDDVAAFAAALERLLADAPLRRALAAAARERALRSFRWDAVVRRVEDEVYRPLRLGRGAAA